MKSLFSWLDRNRDIGVLLLRLFIGVRLIYGVVDNVTSWDHMIAFRDFLDQFGFPLPMVSAVVSVYAQLLAGILFLIGWQIRWGAILMVINFLVAILMVHRNQSFEQMTPALAMLFASLLFLFEGGGRYAIDGGKNNNASGIKNPGTRRPSSYGKVVKL